MRPEEQPAEDCGVTRSGGDVGRLTDDLRCRGTVHVDDVQTSDDTCSAATCRPRERVASPTVPGQTRPSAVQVRYGTLTERPHSALTRENAVSDLRPPEPCAQVRILPRARTGDLPGEPLHPRSSRVVSGGGRIVEARRQIDESPNVSVVLEPPRHRLVRGRPISHWDPNPCPDRRPVSVEHDAHRPEFEPGFLPEPEERPVDSLPDSIVHFVSEAVAVAIATGMEHRSERQPDLGPLPLPVRQAHRCRTTRRRARRGTDDVGRHDRTRTSGRTVGTARSEEHCGDEHRRPEQPSARSPSRGVRCTIERRSDRAGRVAATLRRHVRSMNRGDDSRQGRSAVIEVEFSGSSTARTTRASAPRVRRSPGARSCTPSPMLPRSAPRPIRRALEPHELNCRS